MLVSRESIERRKQLAHYLIDDVDVDSDGSASRGVQGIVGWGAVCVEGNTKAGRIFSLAPELGDDCQ